MLSDISHKKRIKLFFPLGFVKFISKFVEYIYLKLDKKPIFTPYSIYTLGSNGNFSHKKADDYLDYKPRDFYDTLTDTIKFLKNNNVI